MKIDVISKKVLLQAMLSFLVLGSLAESALATNRCADLFEPGARGSGHTIRKDYARALIESGLGAHAYTVDWRLKPEANAGPYARSGEFISVGLPSNKIGTWMDAVGHETIGLGLEGVGALGTLGSAGLRVGRDYYSYTAAMGDAGASRFGARGEFTEATFYVTPREMTEIRKFIEARYRKQIFAQFDMPRLSLEKGDRLDPFFDSGDHFSLRRESCAGACTAFINPKWLEHYEGARILQRLADRLQLEPTGVARAMVWRHIRSPEVIGITQFGIQHGRMDLVENYIRENRYGTLRGLPVYSLIPDPPTGENNQLTAKRTPLSAWLSTFGN
ncbi:MAG: hypothetical protein RBT63_02615 [Bdellovibrionales bacterium]|jgi:hypothetical protein|nr:hypothetical protein [Bdellovibrionales bacterium]